METGNPEPQFTQQRGPIWTHIAVFFFLLRRVSFQITEPSEMGPETEGTETAGHAALVVIKQI